MIHGKLLIDKLREEPNRIILEKDRLVVV